MDLILFRCTFSLLEMLPSSTTTCDNDEGDGYAILSGSRSLKRNTPETEKDAKYWERRKKNNMAAKRSREKSRQFETYFKNRYFELENENALLRRELKNIKLRFGISPQEVFLTDKDRVECTREVNDMTSQFMSNHRRPSRLEMSDVGGEISDPEADKAEKDRSTESANLNHEITSFQKHLPYTHEFATSSNNDSVIKRHLETDMRHQEVVLNQFSGASPSGHYVFYRPMEENELNDNYRPADLSMNKKRKLDDSDNSNTQSRKSQGPKTNKSRTEPHSSAVNDIFLRTSEVKAEENKTVLDLTKEDDDDMNEDLNMKLQKLSDQIEVMQRIVNNRVVNQHDSK